MGTYGENSPIRSKSAKLTKLSKGQWLTPRWSNTRCLSGIRRRKTYEVAPSVYVIPGNPLNAFIVGEDEAELADLISSGDVTVAGIADQAAAVLNLFDRLAP
jgi:hypothetical protein